MYFLKIMSMMFIAETGDKTQLFLVALAARYKLRDVVIGVGAAVILLNALAVTVGWLLGGLLPLTAIKVVAGLLFFAFAANALFGKNKSDVSPKSEKRTVAAVFVSFFLAELGDKTQLCAITFAAGADVDEVLTVFAACSVGLFAADMVGLLAGTLLARRLSDRVLAAVSFAVFSIFAVITLAEGLSLYTTDLKVVAAWTAIPTAVFAGICLAVSGKRRQAEHAREDTIEVGTSLSAGRKDA